VHLTAGMRLRRRLRTASVPREGVFSPDGAIVHLESALRDDRSARAALVSAVRAIERARTVRDRSDPERVLEFWKGLVQGEWSLVDQWESDGRRYMAAYRNRPDVKDPRGLTRFESLVLRYVSLAASNKEVAFTLGISVTAVESAVSQLLRKLRFRRRSDLLALADLSKVQHLNVDVGGDRIGILSLPRAPTRSALQKLSASERDIAAALVRGDSNAEIARARGTSTNTVANQIRAMFEKLGVGSRAQLVAALLRG
jgi:DNA-binding NarL/FixJ family response regulator